MKNSIMAVLFLGLMSSTIHGITFKSFTDKAKKYGGIGVASTKAALDKHERIKAKSKAKKEAKASQEASANDSEEESTSTEE
ncbi:hypothetical protein H0X06_04775 [Candidatus Dependentiae bacterium]|nr:hypothetical protein [Candidatus Dependentiae bacterium]